LTYLPGPCGCGWS